MRLTLTAIAAASITYALAQAPDISSGAIRKHVDYLASDKLTGRGIPSPGLEQAADYIAAEFKQIGLQPAGDDGYSQTYDRVLIKTDLTGYKFEIRGSGRTINVLPTEILLFSDTALNLDDVEIVKIDPATPAWAALKEQDVKGKIVALPILNTPAGQTSFGNASASIGKLKPALILMYGPAAAALNVPGVLIEPGEARPAQVPRFPIRTDAFRNAVGPMPTGPTNLRATLHLRQPLQQPVKLRNLAGILRGSDSNLKDSYIVVSANYDGFPTRRFGDDTIFNCANTNASGVAALIEAAKALARASRKPKRSILFLATSGETPDGPGSKYYREHPIVPTEKTIACINLTQLGRTDSTDGPKLGSAAITGFTRSGIPHSFQSAAEPLGVTFYEDKARDAEAGAARGFKPMLLDKGVPSSHTIYVAFSYPEARRMSDEANKLDYDNMAKISRAIVAGLMSLADSEVK
ncbi:MAG: M28 family peptidase [Acidobacteriota bacterium]|nr:M28 family peptidase [Acidobacteriota bacterium]